MTITNQTELNEARAKRTKLLDEYVSCTDGLHKAQLFADAMAISKAEGEYFRTHSLYGSRR